MMSFYMSFFAGNILAAMVIIVYNLVYIRRLRPFGFCGMKAAFWDIFSSVIVYGVIASLKVVMTCSIWEPFEVILLCVGLAPLSPTIVKRTEEHNGERWQSLLDIIYGTFSGVILLLIIKDFIGRPKQLILILGWIVVMIVMSIKIKNHVEKRYLIIFDFS